MEAKQSEVGSKATRPGESPGGLGVRGRLRAGPGPCSACGWRAVVNETSGRQAGSKRDWHQRGETFQAQNLSNCEARSRREKYYEQNKKEASLSPALPVRECVIKLCEN